MKRGRIGIHACKNDALESNHPLYQCVLGATSGKRIFLYKPHGRQRQHKEKGPPWHCSFNQFQPALQKAQNTTLLTSKLVHKQGIFAMMKKSQYSMDQCNRRQGKVLQATAPKWRLETGAVQQTNVCFVAFSLYSLYSDVMPSVRSGGNINGRPCNSCHHKIPLNAFHFKLPAQPKTPPNALSKQDR